MKIPEAAMHPDALALLNAIFDHPNDDTPRLVYADCLQEHGYEDYAQFIRLSVLAEGGSKPPAERQRLREERFPYWQRALKRLEAEIGPLPPSLQGYENSYGVRLTALEGRKEGLTVHTYDHGMCGKVVANLEDFLSSIPAWWPVITPRELCIFDVQSREQELAEAIGRHLPWVRSLRCLSRPGMDVHNIDEYYFTPLPGRLIEQLARPDLLPRIERLQVTIAFADLSAIEAFAHSALCSQLQWFWLEVRFPGTDRYETVIVTERTEADAVRFAIHSFLDRHRGPAVG